ncbi:GNAT family N-acetyltransferase [Lichenicoccus roseus]|uniref:GNAT family N-acetyltransferase n=1 Tax=Lichenicoccus roseus TaxID=2683649 RepID=A0A5R9J8N7_9PROT|nr:GNAT family N-acetyltransferase [Lichenicoccus roseus]TLU73980.1 GNAT family N-acetyltransferase [Lichenicoccus roseus]
MAQQIHAAPSLRSPPPSSTRIGVDVTFLRMMRPPTEPPPALPDGFQVVTVPSPTVGFYRYLYASVGQDYCWWLRRMAPDAELAALLSHPRISLHVLYHQGEPGGFFELDARQGNEVNIGYFGLMPHLVGQGVGSAFLHAAIAEAWRRTGLRPGAAIRVNTCTADHPRALGTYVRAGFVPVRTVHEVWDIPDRLGLPIPARLRV